MRTVLIAAFLLAVMIAVSPAQDPYSQVPPGYYPNGQPPNGNYHPGYGQGARIPTQPPQQNASFGGPSSGDNPWGIRVQEASGAHPLYQAGQPPANGATQASYVAASMPAGAQPHTVQLCEMAQILGRVGDDVVLTGDLQGSVDDMMARAKSRIAPEKFAEQRAALVKEIIDAIHEYATHVAANEPDPAKSMSDAHRMLLYQMVRQQVDVKLIYQDFRKTVPKEGLAQVEENVGRHFDDAQVKVLMKREKVVSLSDLDSALSAKGSSLDRERRIFKEQYIAQGWVQQKIKPEDGGPEITHQDMIEWYQKHLKEFEHPARVRWEELMTSFAKHSDHNEAYAALAALGNRVLAGASLAEVAKSASDGATAHEGGKWDWTHRDSLDSKTINDALFSLPVNQLSPILEAADGYHIVRVLGRQELTTTSFLDAQKEIKEKIEKERFEKRYQEYVEGLRTKFPIWTVFDASMQPPHDPDDDDRYSGR